MVNPSDAQVLHLPGSARGIRSAITAVATAAKALQKGSEKTGEKLETSVVWY
jgi:hypothetical protein